MRSMLEVTATQLAKGVRAVDYKAPRTGSPDPPAFLVMPTTVGRKAVRIFHEEGCRPARSYLTGKFATWLSHTNPSMRGNATNTIQALDTYIRADELDGRAFVGRGEKVTVGLLSGTITARVDVVMTGNKELSGRAIFWDGQPISVNQAHVIAYPYAEALQRMYPSETISDICVWQVRRGTLHTVSMSDALARAAEADEVLARL